MKREKLAACQKGRWRNIAISLIDLGTGVLSVNACACWKRNQSSNFGEFQRLRRTNIQQLTDGYRRRNSL